MSTSIAQMPRSARGIAAALTGGGLIGLVLTFWLGFEEPNSILFATSAVMMMAAPIAAILHLTTTRDLTKEQKRISRKEFAGANVWSALSEYLSSHDLGTSASRRAVEADARNVTTKR